MSSSPSNRLLLIGTVRKHAALYAISAKVIDGESGRICFASTEEATGDSLVSASKKLAKEISDNIE
jgi:TolB-like protein